MYDIIFLMDDSGSIEQGKLQGELKSLLKSTAFASSLFDQDGFSVRFMNSDREADNIRHGQQAEDLVDGVQFWGATPLVASLRKLLKKQLGEPNQITTVQKPLLVIIITDGMVNSLFLAIGCCMVLMLCTAHRQSWSRISKIDRRLQEQTLVLVSGSICRTLN
jgi:hypothetical protein